MITKEYTIWCDNNCDEWRQEAFIKSKVEFMKEMKMCDWGIYKGKHLCPDCWAIKQQELEESKNERT